MKYFFSLSLAMFFLLLEPFYSQENNGAIDPSVMIIDGKDKTGITWKELQEKFSNSKFEVNNQNENKMNEKIGTEEAFSGINICQRFPTKKGCDNF